MRRKNQKKLLAEHRECIFCAGQRPATTIEHMPNKGMFPRKLRPPGLEFPSCEPCNLGTRWAEDIAAFIGSVQLNSTDEGSEHFEKKLQHLARNNPAALDALRPTSRQRREAAKLYPEEDAPAGAMDLRSPLVDDAMMLFGAKLAIGLHWNETHRVLSKNGYVSVIWFSNESLLNNEVPQHFFELIPKIRRLAQGKLTSKNIFEFGSGEAIDSSTTGHWATFGQSFMYCLSAGEGPGPSYLPTSHVFRPDCFADSKPTILEWMPDYGW